MRTLSTMFVALLVMVTGAWAQPREGLTPEIRPLAGGYFPTGKQRDVLKDAAIAGLQMGFEMRQNVHLIGSFAWSPSKDKALPGENQVDLYQYDVGAELFNSRPLAGDWLFRPFIGAGLGARTYHVRNVSASAQSYFDGYGALGAELQLNRVALRLEGCDYVSPFKGLAGDEKASTRNDVALMLGLAYHL